MTTLSSAAVTAIDELLANYRKEGPGTVVAVANVKGDMIYEKATGKRSVAAEEEMAKDQVRALLYRPHATPVGTLHAY